MALHLFKSFLCIFIHVRKKSKPLGDTVSLLLWYLCCFTLLMFLPSPITLIPSCLLFSSSSLYVICPCFH